MDKTEFGKYIAKLRKGKNLTQQNLADLLNVSVSAVSKWEHGHCFPDVGLFNEIADALGISFLELMSNLQSTETKETAQIDPSNNQLPPKMYLSTSNPFTANTVSDSNLENTSLPDLPEQPVDLSTEGSTDIRISNTYEDTGTADIQQQVIVKKKKWLKPVFLCSLAAISLFTCFSLIVSAALQKTSFSVINTEVVFEKLYDPEETEVYTIYIQIHGKHSYNDIEEHTQAIHEAWENGTAEFKTDSDTICLLYYDTANYEGTEEEYRAYLFKRN